jgi:alpha-L-fucosidase
MHYEPTLESLKQHPIPDWFHNAKLGVLVVWGLFSVPAWAPLTGNINEVAAREGWEAYFANNPYAEWYLNSLLIKDSPTQRHHLETYGPNFAYDDFVPMFNAAAEKWNPDDWADLYEKSGIKYVVFLTKHHDGFILWPSKYTTPYKPNYYARRDITGELTTAVRKRGIQMGLYYSGGLDWSFKHTVIKSQATLFECVPQNAEYVEYANSHWRDLIERYEPAALWNDIAYPRAANLPALFADYYNRIPHGVINDRFGQRPPVQDPIHDEILTPSVGDHYDFRTPEYTTYSRTQQQKWECTRGLGYSFSYNMNEGEAHTIPFDKLVRMFVDIVSKNGNLLLSFGPMADGTVPTEQRDRLERLGAWLKVNGDAIYDTRPWIRAEGIANSGIPVRFTHKGRAVYAILLDTPQTSNVKIADLRAEPGTTVYLLGHDRPLNWTQNGADLTIELLGSLPSSPAHAFKLVSPSS